MGSERFLLHICKFEAPNNSITEPYEDKNFGVECHPRRGPRAITKSKRNYQQSEKVIINDSSQNIRKI